MMWSNASTLARCIQRRGWHERRNRLNVMRLQSSASSPPPTLRASTRRELKILVAGAGAVGGYLTFSSDWDEYVRNAKDRLLSTNATTTDANDFGGHDSLFHAGSSASLPPPVSRYLEKVINSQSTTISTNTATVNQSGEFYAAQQWYPFTAQLLATTPTPGFVWEAQAQIMQMPNRILESYINGQGNIVTRAWGKLPLIQVQEEEPYVLFWLAMTPLFPQVFLQQGNAGSLSSALTWKATHDLYMAKAELVVTDETEPFQVEFYFRHDNGLLESILVTSPALPHPWRASFKDYGSLDGNDGDAVLAPCTIEIGKWHGDDDFRLHLKIRHRDWSYR